MNGTYNCTVGLREAQRYLRVFKSRDLLDTLNADWRDELTLTGANKVLSEHFGADGDDGEDEDDDEQSGHEDGGDAENHSAEDGENQESETDSEKSEDMKEFSGDDETDDFVSAFHDFIKTAVGSLKKVNTIIRTAPNLQSVSAIEADLKRLRDDCDQRINQCRRRLNSFPEVKDVGTARTVATEHKKRPAKPKPPIRPGRAGYDSSLTGISAMA